MKNKDTFTFITFLTIFITYSIIGYIFNVDMLQFISIKREGVNISLIAILLPAIISYCIYFLLKLLDVDINFRE